MASSNGNIFRVTGHLCGEFTGPTKASDAELWCFLICTRINGWVNSDEAGDLRRYRAHYDVTVMELFSTNLIYLKLGYDTITHQYHDFNGSFSNKSHFDENMFENDLHKHTRLKPIHGIWDIRMLGNYDSSIFDNTFIL